MQCQASLHVKASAAYEASGGFAMMSRNSSEGTIRKGESFFLPNSNRRRREHLMQELLDSVKGNKGRVIG